MLGLLIFKILETLSGLFGSLGSLGYRVISFFFKRDAALEAENEALKQEIVELKKQCERIIDVQKEQAEVCIQPTPDRSAVDQWLHENRDTPPSQS
ncbi:hypothetical protein Cva_00306 [Caedimonas varicaedens]|uniref:Uncharacterized protein n=1 Tax=Caedimonas varicaedens TaxID=1629334 RepID=A0A0K8MAX3_9PROT|nr:hypothetical protein Cva_00306 [Caedimonas varicaedens]